MAVKGDPRYRGRRRTAPKRRPGHLRTNYVEDDFIAFKADLKLACGVWPESVRKGDRKAQWTSNLIGMAAGAAVGCVPLTGVMIWQMIEGRVKWYYLIIAQSVVMAYILILVLMRYAANMDEDIDIIIYREADRRGIKYKKGDTPLYYIMNRINADYNSYLWNRHFNWECKKTE